MQRRSFLIAGLTAALGACGRPSGASASTPATSDAPPARPRPLHHQLAQAAEARLLKRVRYDPAYLALSYPGGDPPDDRGVCTDVIVRAYRGIGVDLQVDVHEDMTAHFSHYPDHWGLRRPDRNIDHRRVPNLEAFFIRSGARLGVDVPETHLQPGDLVTWRVDRLPHIGVASTRTDRSGRALFVHNIGAGPQIDGCYGAWPRAGVFRYRPWET